MGCGVWGVGCGVWGVGCGVWGFTHFQAVNYLIFREKVPEFSPRSLPCPVLFDFPKSLKVLPNTVFRFIQQALVKLY
ncbi:hypothetical protein B1L04_18910 [Microcystis aeruginosa KW]|uniref:Type IV pilin PilA n=1 Tax=Microcystis aeruginosa KW TaxID=1960155 RepID=A0A1V4BUB7_MICAE|nr:hypothetical protein B1L04_18910 [Microcystis aeruginosa KW]